MEKINARDLFPKWVHKIYLASPFFNREETKVYKAVINYLRDAGYEVYVPQEHDIPDGDIMENWMWGKAVYSADIEAISHADAVLVINWGMYSDSGTAWEQGYAMGCSKFVVSVQVPHDEKDISIVSLMMANGCDVCVSLTDLLDVEGFDAPAIWEQK